MNRKNNKKILIAPLDWGLGHAVRDIPLIHKLSGAGYEIILAGSGSSLELLKSEFPDLKHYTLPSVLMKYSGKSSFFIFKLLIQTPKFIFNIKEEQKQLKKIIVKENIDFIISDNRYGVYSRKIPSIFISHQIFLKLPKHYKFFEKLINNIQKRYIHKFDKCLIPDFSGKINLSGELSHKTKLPDFYNFIGTISRFKTSTKKYEKKYDIIFILSGPEPQRTIFYEKVYSQIKKTTYKTLIVSGKPENKLAFKDKNIEHINHLSGNELQEAILSSEIVITRAGYTSVMDFVKLRKKAILIPTPGQTEQLYLAEHLKNKRLFVFENQDNFKLTQLINKLNKLTPDFSIFDNLQKESFIDIIKTSFNPDYLDTEKCITKNRKS
ncbi:MAG: hypothetical protein L3J35_08270 [Bacteroidales bacterium]|nr:hypothetical protein [Bacteroidales bacterium]